MHGRVQECWLALGLSLLACGCGRVGFNPVRSDVADAGLDASVVLDAAVPLDGSLDAALDAPPASDASVDGDGAPVADADAAGPDGFAGDARVPPTDSCSTELDALWCESFEGTPTDLVLDVAPDGGVARVEASGAHLGEAGLWASTQTNLQYARVVVTPAPLYEDVYFRGYFRIPSGAVTGRLNLVEIGRYEANGVLDVNVNGDGSAELYFDSPRQDRFVTGAGAVPFDEWVCVQVHDVVSDSQGGATLWIDGQQVLDSDRTQDTLSTGGIDQVRFGIEWTEAGQGPVQIAVDDVVLDDAPVPCL